MYIKGIYTVALDTLKLSSNRLKRYLFRDRILIYIIIGEEWWILIGNEGPPTSNSSFKLQSQLQKMPPSVSLKAIP